jgi:ribosome-binding protein aMBF1 (putative translation factor)
MVRSPVEATMSRMLDTSYHERMLADRMQDPEFREAYERAQREIVLFDSVIQQLDESRRAAGISKAELARRIGRNPSSIRRLFTAGGNPTLSLLASVAAELDVDIVAVERRPRNTRRSAA